MIWIPLCLCGLALLWLIYTSGFAVMLRGVAMFLICPKELRAPFLALMAATAQHAGSVREADYLETMAGKLALDGKWQSIRVELRSKDSIGYGLTGLAREEATDSPYDRKRDMRTPPDEH